MPRRASAANSGFCHSGCSKSTTRSRSRVMWVELSTFYFLLSTFYRSRKPFVHDDLPVFVCRLHLEVKRARLLADVGNVASRAFAVHHRQDHAAADRAS